MVINRIYKIYSATEYNNLDLNKFYTGVRWNLDRTKCILEYKVDPEDLTNVLNHSEALSIVRTADWSATDIDI